MVSDTNSFSSLLNYAVIVQNQVLNIYLLIFNINVFTENRTDKHMHTNTHREGERSCHWQKYLFTFSVGCKREMTKHKVLGFVFALLVCVFKILLLVVTPLYLDCLNPVHTGLYNISSYRQSTPSVISSTLIINDVPIDNTTTPVWQRIDPFFGIWISMGFDTLLFGVILLVLYLCVPGQITERERNYPKKVFLQAGACQAVSALLYQFSTSGKRTAPYLQGPLNYFLIPETFILR